MAGAHAGFPTMMVTPALESFVSFWVCAVECCCCRDFSRAFHVDVIDASSVRQEQLSLSKRFRWNLVTGSDATNKFHSLPIPDWCNASVSPHSRWCSSLLWFINSGPRKAPSFGYPSAVTGELYSSICQGHGATLDRDSILGIILVRISLGRYALRHTQHALHICTRFCNCWFSALKVDVLYSLWTSSSVP